MVFGGGENIVQPSMVRLQVLQSFTGCEVAIVEGFELIPVILERK